MDTDLQQALAACTELPAEQHCVHALVTTLNAEKVRVLQDWSTVVIQLALPVCTDLPAEQQCVQLMRAQSGLVTTVAGNEMVCPTQHRGSHVSSRSLSSACLKVDQSERGEGPSQGTAYSSAWSMCWSSVRSCLLSNACLVMLQEELQRQNCLHHIAAGALPEHTSAGSQPVHDGITCKGACRCHCRRC